jgi:transcriptional regulator with XRE-family HTH domain
MWLKCYTQQEIAEKVVKTQQAVAKRLEIQKNEILQKLQKHQKTYNYSDAVHL